MVLTLEYHHLSDTQFQCPCSRETTAGLSPTPPLWTTWHVPDPMNNLHNDDLPRAVGEAELCCCALELIAADITAPTKDRACVIGLGGGFLVH